MGTTETVWRIDAAGGTTGTRSSIVDASGNRLGFTGASGTATWTLFDELGSIAALEPADGTLSEAYRYDAYGQAIAIQGGSQATTVNGNPFRFRGAINLGTDGSPLYEMGARLYAPSSGTFTSMDTVAGGAADPASMNRFLYAQGNPTTLIDPTGHCARFMDGVCADARTSAYTKAVKAKKAAATESTYETSRGTRSYHNGKASSTVASRGHREARGRLLLYPAAADVVFSWGQKDVSKANFSAGRAFQRSEWDAEVRNYDGAHELYLDSTFKDPASGRSISRLRPDTQYVDPATGLPTLVKDYKSSTSSDLLAKSSAETTAKYNAEMLKIPGMTKPAPVEIVGEIRPAPAAPAITGGRLLNGAFGLVSVCSIYTATPEDFGIYWYPGKVVEGNG